MPQQYKIERVAKIKEDFEKHGSYIFTDYRGLSVAKITELRNELRPLQAKYTVVKNNFTRIVANEMKVDELGINLIGPTAVVYVEKDASEILKVLFKFEKESSLQVKGGWIDGQLYDKAQLEALSKLPSKDQLIAMFMQTCNAPLQNFVFACNDILVRLVRVVKAVGDSKNG